VEQGRTSRFGFFKDQPQPCATIVQGVGFHSPHTLAYGQAVTAELSPGRTVTCASAVDGLTCTSADGIGSRGFQLTVDSFTII
jgi:plastocyanin domain-containing protein